MTLNAEIFYAYKIVMEPTALTVGDALILHSLGAAWSKQGCQGENTHGRPCQQTTRAVTNLGWKAGVTCARHHSSHIPGMTEHRDALAY